MSIITQKDLHNHLTTAGINKLIGWLNKLEHAQKTAATATTGLMGVVRQDGTVGSLYFISRSLAAAAETMTVDILVNGSSILTAPFVFDTDNANIQKQIDLMHLLDPTKVNLKAGDCVEASRTLANGSTLTSSLVGLEPRVSAQR